MERLTHAFGCVVFQMARFLNPQRSRKDTGI